MKKLINIVIWAMILSLSFVPAVAFADDDMAVKVISEPSLSAVEESTMDDMKKNSPYTVDGWGTVTVTDCQFTDQISTTDIYYNNFIKSGEDADYLWLHCEILNRMKDAHNFKKEAEIKAIFDDDYEFAGWVKQLRSENDNVIIYKSDDEYSIDPLYQGHYCIGCTLPNFVINSTAPLKLVFTIDNKEFTYIVRQ